MKIKQCNFSPLSVILIAVCCCATFAQTKRNLTPQDYGLWHRLNMGTVSNDGIWTSYTKSYENDVDTLFLKNTVTDYEYVIPNGYNEKLTKDGRIFGYLKSDTLHMVDTIDGKDWSFPNVKRYEFTKDGKYLLYIGGISYDSLRVLDTQKKETTHFSKVMEFSMDPTEKNLAIVQKIDNTSIVKLIGLSDVTVHHMLSHSSEDIFQDLTWNSLGTSLAYYRYHTINGNYGVDFVGNVNKPSGVKFLNNLHLDIAPLGMNILKSKLLISDKGDRVFFDIAPSMGNTNDAPEVQVWKSSDSRLLPNPNPPFMYWQVWMPFQGKVMALEDNNLQACALTKGQEMVVLLNNDQYLPIYEYGDYYSDVYLMDLRTGKRELILQQQLNTYGHIVTSMQGNHIAYFKDKNWWSYNMKTKTYRCITGNLGKDFNRSLSDSQADHQAFGFGGWTTKDEMIVYDRFDIWLLAPDGSRSEKLTHGVGSKTRHRLNNILRPTKKNSFFGHLPEVYDLQNGLLIHTVDTKDLSEGFGAWNFKQGFKQIIHEKMKILFIKEVGEGGMLQYVRSSFDVSPQILGIKAASEPVLIARSNEHQKQFHWGESKLIHYSAPNGTSLKGVLFYPANYSADTTYPLIVSIYENLSYGLHDYVFPALNDHIGLNIANLTAEGYFVLYPDISYSLNQPGRSALDCVMAAVDQALKSASIDEKRMGLTGHSFGGFETTYIISQTDRFATARVGGAVTDLLSFYLDIDSSNLSNMERFECGQFRNKIPFTEPKFHLESPIMNVVTISTPLLLWTGSKDNVVPPSYSQKFYAAMWRLRKKSTLLIYPNEGHSLLQPSFQFDLTNKTLDWFNHYLKGAPEKDWMKN